jgi:hypothetical protein
MLPCGLPHECAFLGGTGCKWQGGCTCFSGSAVRRKVFHSTQAIQDVELSGADPLGSLHACLEAYAFKVLPAHAQRANLHFDCFKALSTEKGGDKKVRASGVFSWQATQKPKRRMRARPPSSNTGAAEASLEGLVSGMVGKLEAIFVAEED